MTARVMQEVAKLQTEGPSADLTSRAREAAKRSYETSLRQNEYWLGRLQASSTFGRDPHEILTRTQRIDAVTPERLQEIFKRYFPADRATIVTLKPMAAASP
jgi:predicted Zn-dependent peptidase